MLGLEQARLRPEENLQALEQGWAQLPEMGQLHRQLHRQLRLALEQLQTRYYKVVVAPVQQANLCWRLPPEGTGS